MKVCDMKMIETVQGPIAAKALGVTMMHEHFAIDLSRVRQEDDSTFGREAEVLDELLAMKAAGADAVVEVTGNDMGRDVLALKALSEASGVHIIASTGYYIVPYHSLWLIAASARDIMDVFVRDLSIGIDGTDIKAGIIAEIGGSDKELAPSEIKVFKAAAWAGKELDRAVSTHCQLGQLGDVQADLLIAEGMPAERIILGHIDLANDQAYFLRLLDRGVNIAFDTIGKTNYLSDETRADQLAALLERGHASQLVLSQDVSRKSYFKSRGDYAGYTAVLKDFIPRLKARGVKDSDIHQMLVENPARILQGR